MSESQKYNVLVSPKQSIDDNVLFSIPGSKSYTNRSILIAAIADGVSVIKYPLFSDDTHRMISCLGSLGVKIEQHQDGLTVRGNNGKFDSIADNTLFTGIAGTTSRFLTGLCLLISDDIVITGEKKILERPIGDLVGALEELGLGVEYLGNLGSLPLKINGSKKIGSEVTISGANSSQFVSALLMAAPRLPGGLKVNVVGDQVSKSYIRITIDIMQSFGVSVTNNNYAGYNIRPQEYKHMNYAVESDWSGASYFFAVAGLLGSPVSINNMNPASVQGDAGVVKIVEKFGVDCDFSNMIATLQRAKKYTPQDVEIDMVEMPDAAPTIMVLAAMAGKTTTITGLSTLKKKECDRLEVPKAELAKLGIKAETSDDSITIYGAANDFATSTDDVVEIDTYDDHRIAMAFALFGTKRKVLIKDAGVINKSFPSYWDEISKVVNVQKIDV